MMDGVTGASDPGTCSAILTVEIVIGLIDIAFALMAIPNMIAIIYLSGIVTKEMKSRSWI